MANFVLPKDMTAHRLRQMAAIMDAADVMAVSIVDLDSIPECAEKDHLIRILADKTAPNLLRLWAAAIERDQL
jgi:hypothetical protein